MLRLQPKFDVSRVITTTTRQIRENEAPGKDYNFLKLSEFEQKISNGLFLEHTKYSGDYYGSPSSILSDLGGW